MAEAVAIGSAAAQEGEGIMATFILVPGAMHPAWCWHRIVPLLEQGGHRAIAIDLPGTGEDRSIDRRDATLAIWADHVADQVRRAEGPVLLTGHSRGGLVISEIQHLPNTGEHVDALGWRFEVIDLDGRRIDKVLASRLPGGSDR